MDYKFQMQDQVWARDTNLEIIKLEAVIKARKPEEISKKNTDEENKILNIEPWHPII